MPQSVLGLVLILTLLASVHLIYCKMRKLIAMAFAATVKSPHLSIDLRRQTLISCYSLDIVIFSHSHKLTFSHTNTHEVTTIGEGPSEKSQGKKGICKLQYSFRSESYYPDLYGFKLNCSRGCFGIL